MIAKFVLFTLLLFPASLTAQMFSVGASSEVQQKATSNYFRLGFGPVDFSYSHEPGSVLPQNRLDFNSPAVIISFESPGLTASMSFVNKLTGADDERFLHLNLQYTNRFAFVRSSYFQLGIPLRLQTSLLSVQKEQLNNDFGQTVLGVGAGAFTSFSIPEKVVLSLEGIPSYGFSSSSGGLFGGSNKALTAKARLDFLNLLFGRTISLGYDYKISVYDLDNNEYDYDMNYHLLTIGLSL
ncbi:MAG: hypothetical protein ABJH08_13370 [Balneola sp.]